MIHRGTVFLLVFGGAGKKFIFWGVFCFCNYFPNDFSDVSTTVSFIKVRALGDVITNKIVDIRFSQEKLFL